MFLSIFVFLCSVRVLFVWLCVPVLLLSSFHFVSYCSGVCIVQELMSAHVCGNTCMCRPFVCPYPCVGGPYVSVYGRVCRGKVHVWIAGCPHGVVLESHVWVNLMIKFPLYSKRHRRPLLLSRSRTPFLFSGES